MALVDAEIAKVNAFSERLRVELEAQVDRVRKDHDTWVASGSDEGQARRRRHAPAPPPAQLSSPVLPPRPRPKRPTVRPSVRRRPTMQLRPPCPRTSLTLGRPPPLARRGSGCRPR
jgi:hypothetical protein